MTNKVVSLIPNDDDELPYIASHEELTTTIREAILGWPELDVQAEQFAGKFWGSHEIADRLFPGTRNSLTSKLKALAMVVSVVIGSDRTDDQQDTIDRLTHVLQTLREIAFVEPVDADTESLGALDREHARRLLRAGIVEAKERLSGWLHHLKDDDGNENGAASHEI